MKLTVLALALALCDLPALAGEPDGLTLPPGFHATVVTEGLGPVRHLAVRANGDIYVSNDFGVMRLPSGSTDWEIAGTGLPMVEVAGLTIVPSARKLYAATHGRSAWQLTLP